MEIMEHQITELTRRVDQLEKYIDVLRYHVNTEKNRTDARFEAIATWLESEDE